MPSSAFVCPVPWLSSRRPDAISGRKRMTKATLATDEITEAIHEKLELGKVTSFSRGGSSGWASTHRVTTDTGHSLFIKVSREDVSMFEGEAAGLNAMHETNTISVPKVYHFAELERMSGSYIVMDALNMRGVFDMGELGRQLAEMHLAEPVLPEAKSGQFGFHVENTIGATPQPNGWMHDWIDFFRQRRLLHQALLTDDATLIEKAKRLAIRLDELFEDVADDIRPSLIHGDFWSGNVDGIEKGPVIYDPACYYAHHEAEFGMKWCMQLSDLFWTEYRKLIPEAPGFSRRLKLYQLYHYLNHYNLFGGSYYYMADSLLTELLP